MKKRCAFLIVFLSLFITSHAQILLPVKVTIQEQDQWCWAGVSQCILDYYEVEVEQCEIAEYARQVITWRVFGADNCCVKPNGPCNYWNYNWGEHGSIQEILRYFGQLDNVGVYRLSLAQVGDELAENRPFIIRWGWTGGGGHFVVGHGLSGLSTLHYMDPWFGEGAKFANYDWVAGNDGLRNWTHTNVIQSRDLGSISISAVVSLDWTGTITPSGTIHVPLGENQTYKMTPSPGYRISQVLVNGVNDETAVSSGSYTFTNVAKNHTIKASFIPSSTNNILTATENVTEVKIYPNPSPDGLINIEVAEKSIVKVFDLLGNQVGLYNINAHSDLQLNLFPGLYFIHIESNGKTSTHKIIVQ
jgi:hypothetical protein